MPAPQLPEITDPNMAYMVVLIEQLSGDVKEQRDEVNARFDKADERFKTIEENQEKVNRVVTRAQGGYLVILGIGAVFGWALDIYGKVVKVFQGAFHA